MTAASRAPPAVGRTRADGLVGRDGHVLLAAYEGQLVHFCAGLFHVLEPAGRAIDLGQVGEGLVGVQAALASIRMAPSGPEGLSDRRNPFDLGGHTASSSVPSGPRWATLTFRRCGTRRTPGRSPGPARPDGGDGHVDRHALPLRFGPADEGRLVGGAQPGRGLRVVVVPERRQLAPAGRPARRTPSRTSMPRKRVRRGAALDQTTGSPISNTRPRLTTCVPTSSRSGVSK